MKLHGSITANLEGAIASTQRLRGHLVYSDTTRYWRELVREARRTRTELPENERLRLDALVARLEGEMIERERRIERSGLS
jgi:polyhydroxyalkanoate synthesis regulator phasin